MSASVADGHKQQVPGSLIKLGANGFIQWFSCSYGYPAMLM